MAKERMALETITPARAEKMLKRIAPGQRNLNPARVATYVRAMRVGRWPLTWDAMALDEEGAVANGVHRLHAVIEAGESIQQYVLHNVSQDAIDLGDQGQVRNIRQTLIRHGYPHPGVLDTSARMLFRWSRGLGPGDRRLPVSWPDVEQVLFEHDELQNYSPVGRDLATDGLLRSPGLGAMLAYVFAWVDPKKGRAFVNAWSSKEITSGRDPVSGLREWLALNQPQPGAKGSGVDTDDKAANAIIAFNLWRAGEPWEKAALWRKDYRRSKPAFPGIDLPADTTKLPDTATFAKFVAEGVTEDG